MIFDFDGVLVDSIEEVVLTAYNAGYDLSLTDQSELPPLYPEVFRLNRHHVQPAGDFLPYTRWCVEQAKRGKLEELGRAEYAALIAEDASPLKKRAELFFSARQRFLKLAPKHWFELHTPYQPLWNHLRSMMIEPPWILTNKNKQAVIELCRHFDLLVKEERIYSGEGGKTKTENFISLSRTLPHSQLNFIDDSVHNLIVLRRDLTKVGLDLELLHANWGYVGGDDIATAQEWGFASLSQNEFLKTLN